MRHFSFTELIHDITNTLLNSANLLVKSCDAWRKDSASFFSQADAKFRDTLCKNERASERVLNAFVRRAGSAVGASLSQSHQTTVIATGATSHRALDAEANTITPWFGSFSFFPSSPFCPSPLSSSLFLSLSTSLASSFPFSQLLSLSFSSRLVPSSFRALSSFNLRFPNVSIARLRVPPRR